MFPVTSIVPSLVYSATRCLESGCGVGRGMIKNNYRLQEARGWWKFIVS